MFVDEELEKTFDNFVNNLEGEEFTKEDIRFLANQLLAVLISRMPSKEEVFTMKPEVFLNKLKQLDNAWKLFCKKHPGLFNESFWRNWVLASDTPEGKFKYYLGW